MQQFVDGSSGNPAIRQSGNPAIRQSGNPAIRQSGNPAIRQSGNPAIRQKRNHGGSQAYGWRRDPVHVACPWSLLIAAGVGFAGCQNRDLDASVSAPALGASEGSRFGFVQVALTDAPLEEQGITAVNICIERVDLFFADDEPRGIIAVSRTINLLDLRGGVTTALGITQFPVDVIHQVRLILCADGATVVVDDIAQPLNVPGGEQTGIKLNAPGGFEVRENASTTIVIDFDAAESIHRAGDRWMLTPVVQLVERAIVLAVTAPAPGAFVPLEPTVRGTVASKEPLASVLVNGVEASLDGSSWQAQIQLSEAATTITVLAADQAGRTATVVFEVSVDNRAPLVSVTEPLNGIGVFRVASADVRGEAYDYESGLASVVIETSTLTVPVGISADGAFVATVELDTSLGPDEVYASTMAVVVATDHAGNSTRQWLGLSVARQEMPRNLFVTFDRRIPLARAFEIARAEGARVTFTLAKRNQLELMYPTGTDLDSAAQALRALPEVVGAARVPLGVAAGAVMPNDFFDIGDGPVPGVITGGSSQFGLAEPIHVAATLRPDGSVEHPGAWDIETGKTETLLAVIDTTFDYTHPDLYLNVWVNNGEIPAPGVDVGSPPRFTTLRDPDGDGVITFYDLNDPENLVFLRGASGQELPERCIGGVGLPERPELPCNPAIDGADLVDGNAAVDVGYEGDLNGDGCPGVCGVDDDLDGRPDLEDLEVLTADYDRDGVSLADGDLDEAVAAANDDDENGFADDMIGWDFGCDNIDDARTSVGWGWCRFGDPPRIAWDNAPLAIGMWEVTVCDPQGGDCSRPQTLSSHGTSVASIIGATGNNAGGGRANIAGINWRGRVVLVAIGVLESDLIATPIPAYGYLLQLAKAARATRGIGGLRAVNASFGQDVARSGTESAADSAMWSGVADLDAAGVLLVASAGNTHRDLGEPSTLVPVPGVLPYPNVVTVGAVDRLGSIAAFSNTGWVDVDLGATGAHRRTVDRVLLIDILGLDAGDQLGRGSLSVTTTLPVVHERIMGLTAFSGTSAAAPMVTGTIGLMASVRPTLTSGVVKQHLLDTVTRTDPPLDVATGGILNAHAAVLLARDREIPLPSVGPIDVSPRLTADGSSVLFLTTRRTAGNPFGKLRLASVDAELGRGLAVLQVPADLAGHAEDRDLAVSADGRRVILSSTRAGGLAAQLFYVDHDPATGGFGSAVALTALPEMDHTLPASSPNGVVAAFVRRPMYTESRQIFVQLLVDPRAPQEFGPLPFCGAEASGTWLVLDVAVSNSLYGSPLVAAVVYPPAPSGETAYPKILAWDGSLDCHVVADFRSSKMGVAITPDGSRIAFGSGCEYGPQDPSAPAGQGCGRYGVWLIDTQQDGATFSVVNSVVLPPAVGTRPTDSPVCYSLAGTSPWVGGISDDGQVLSWTEPILPELVSDCGAYRPPGDRMLVVGTETGDAVVLRQVSAIGTDDILFLAPPFRSRETDLSANGQRLVYARAADAVLGTSETPQVLFRIDGFALPPVPITEP